MRQLRTFIDERIASHCVYCGSAPSTREHIPSKVLLDEPYPEQLPAVRACTGCNRGFSDDEQYLACLVDCVITGTTRPSMMPRPKTRQLMTQVWGLRKRVGNARIKRSGGTLWDPDTATVQRIILKLAVGHVAYELGDPPYDEPRAIRIAPLGLMSPDERASFEEVPSATAWPEVGSRAMIMMAEGRSIGWIEVQPGRYRYLALTHGGLLVRIVLSEYLAAEVFWD